MSPTELTQQRFTILRAFRVGFGAIIRHPLQMLAIVLAVAIPLNVGTEWISDHDFHSPVIAIRFAYGFFVILVIVTAFALINAAMAAAVGAHVQGQPVRLRTCFEHGFAAVPRLLPAVLVVTAPIWVSVLIERYLHRSFGVDLELSGLLMILVMPLFAPVAAGEHIGPMRLVVRTWSLYAGQRWRLLGIMLLTLLTGVILMTLFTEAATALHVLDAARLAIACLSWSITVMPAAAAYALRRRDREGGNELALAPLFD